MLFIGGAFPAWRMFIGRPYCRWLCPYGSLLAWCSRLARRSVSITPDKELDCGLCTHACPYGAIEQMRAVGRNCLSVPLLRVLARATANWLGPKADLVTFP